MMFTAVLFIIMKNLKQFKCPVVRNWLSRFWSISIMEHFTTRKKVILNEQVVTMRECHPCTCEVPAEFVMISLSGLVLIILFFEHLFFLVVLGFELRVPCLLGRQTMSHAPNPLCFLVIFLIGSHVFCSD
jgi:hypothetical protein